MSIEAAPGGYRVRFAYDPDLVRSIKQALRSRRWDPVERCWWVEAWEGEALERWVESLGEGTPEVEPSLPEPSLPLYPYQRESVEYAMARDGRVFLADEMGLGKTLEALAVVDTLRAYPALVLCPSVGGLGPRKWAAECERWLPDRSVHVVEDTNPAALPPGTEIMIVNYEKLPYLARLPERKLGPQGRIRLLPPLSDAVWRALVCDEVHYLKDYRAKRSRIVMAIASDPSLRVRLGLSGTPLLNRPAELIHPLRIIGRLRDLGGWSWFVRRYCGARQTRFGLDLSGARNLQELSERLRRTCMIRHLKRDVLPQLPERVLVELEARLTNEDDYREAEADCIAWLREHHGELRASAAARAEALVRLGLLRQLAGAGKIDAAAAWIEEFLEESDRKLVVFCWHREVVRALAGRVPGRAGIVIGGEAARNREAVREFQSSKGLRVLVCSLAACREAIDLTCASDCLLVELPWRPADIQQAEARMYGRVNDLHGLNSTVLLAEGTIDSTLWAVLKRKQEVFDRTLGDEPDVDTLSDVVTGILSRQGGGY